MRDKIINAVAFQIIWFACVAGGASGLWWVGPAAVVAFALWQIPRVADPKAELKLAAFAALIGLTADSSYMLFGLLQYPQPGPWSSVAPIWIIALWIGFALTLNHSMTWLHGRPLLAALLGAVSAPFSYWVGATAWGAVEFTAALPIVIAVLAISWSVMTPLLIVIAERGVRLQRQTHSLSVRRTRRRAGRRRASLAEAETAVTTGSFS